MRSAVGGRFEGATTCRRPTTSTCEPRRDASVDVGERKKGQQPTTRRFAAAFGDRSAHSLRSDASAQTVGWQRAKKTRSTRPAVLQKAVDDEHRRYRRRLDVRERGHHSRATACTPATGAAHLVFAHKPIDEHRRLETLIQRHDARLLQRSLAFQHRPTRAAAAKRALSIVKARSRLLICSNISDYTSSPTTKKSIEIADKTRHNKQEKKNKCGGEKAAASSIYPYENESLMGAAMIVERNLEIVEQRECERAAIIVCCLDSK